MSKRTTNEEFITKARNIHGNIYDYSEVTFINIKVDVNIICDKHGVYQQRPQHHLAGHGCNKCARESVTDSSRLTKETFINKATKTHGNKYDYSLLNFDMVNSNNDKVDILCYKHGAFNQSIRHHLSGSGCPVCKESKGEAIISKYLTENNIKHIRQHRFKDCKYKKPLPFDFYLPNHNTCVEYQGEQHFRPTTHWGGETEFKNVVKRDKIKMEYCLDNNIPLIKINYNDDIINKLSSL